jgi:hypothetical protein
MAKFFLPLILLTLIAWVIVGVQQEYGDISFYDERSSDSITVQPNYTDSLSLEKYYNYQLNIAGNLHFLLPTAMISTTELTNESDAYMQFYRDDPKLNFIVYKDNFSSDVDAYNYSLDKYISATINGSKEKSTYFNMEDSVNVNLTTGQKATLVSFTRTKTYDDGTENIRHITFLATSDEDNLYMLYFYCDTADYKQNLKDIHNVFTSTSIVRY